MPSPSSAALSIAQQTALNELIEFAEAAFPTKERQLKHAMSVAGKINEYITQRASFNSDDRELLIKAAKQAEASFEVAFGMGAEAPDAYLALLGFREDLEHDTTQREAERRRKTEAQRKRRAAKKAEQQRAASNNEDDAEMTVAQGPAIVSMASQLQRIAKQLGALMLSQAPTAEPAVTAPSAHEAHQSEPQQPASGAHQHTQSLDERVLSTADDAAEAVAAVPRSSSAPPRKRSRVSAGLLVHESSPDELAAAELATNGPGIQTVVSAAASASASGFVETEGSLRLQEAELRSRIAFTHCQLRYHLQHREYLLADLERVLQQQHLRSGPQHGQESGVQH
ncbi:hypothetical protein MKEN_00125900 [Mycena kentingensis (nom. inval.)]|nr:hypothetical protein MKEN_00125900 [Mycena kentingensis (nom. inval.)]